MNLGFRGGGGQEPLIKVKDFLKGLFYFGKLYALSVKLLVLQYTGRANFIFCTKLNQFSSLALWQDDYLQDENPSTGKKLHRQLQIYFAIGFFFFFKRTILWGCL